MKKKILTILRILVPLLVLGLFIWIIFLKNIVPMTKRKFEDFNTFKEKSESSFYAQILPKSAENVEYYWHSGSFIKTSGYCMKLSDEDYESWKKDAESRYDGYMTASVTESYKYDGNSSEKSIEFDKLEDEGIGFVKELCGADNENCYMFLSMKRYGTSFRYYYGVICNDSSNEVTEFYYLNSNKYSFNN